METPMPPKEDPTLAATDIASSEKPVETSEPPVFLGNIHPPVAASLTSTHPASNAPKPAVPVSNAPKPAVPVQSSQPPKVSVSKAPKPTVPSTSVQKPVAASSSGQKTRKTEPRVARTPPEKAVTNKTPTPSKTASKPETVKAAKVVPKNKTISEKTEASEATAKSAKLLTTYRARLSSRDHANSAGVKLGKAIQVLQQDRANYHLRPKLRDNEDEMDKLFTSKKARRQMKKYWSESKVSKTVQQLIMSGTPVVEVSVWDDGSMTVVVVE